MISLKREDVKQYSSPEALVEVSYRIPDAAEAEVVLGEMWKDTKIVETYVKEIKSADIDGWQDGIKAAELKKIPGAYSLIHLIAVDIVNDMRGEFSRKK